MRDQRLQNSKLICGALITCALILSGCLPSATEKKNASAPNNKPVRESTCMAPKDFKQVLQTGLVKLPDNDHHKVDISKFGHWLAQLKKQGAWGHDLVFRNLSPDLARVQLSKTTLTVEAVVLK